MQALSWLNASGEHVARTAIVGTAHAGSLCNYLESLSRIEAMQFGTQPQDFTRNDAEAAPRAVADGVDLLNHMLSQDSSCCA